VRVAQASVSLSMSVPPSLSLRGVSGTGHRRIQYNTFLGLKEHTCISPRSRRSRVYSAGIRQHTSAYVSIRQGRACLTDAALVRIQAKIKPTDPLRSPKQEARRKRNCSSIVYFILRLSLSVLLPLRKHMVRVTKRVLGDQFKSGRPC
jgi:hypothetical protein